MITEEYALSEDIADHLTFSYHDYPNQNKTKKICHLKATNGKLLENRCLTNEKGVKRELRLTDISLHVHYKAGEVVQRDITCDAGFMLGVTHKIGQSIRSKMKYVDAQKTIHLCMDNAGGHGTNAAKAEYT